jgi:hypothetical protein
MSATRKASPAFWSRTAVSSGSPPLPETGGVPIVGSVPPSSRSGTYPENVRPRGGRAGQPTQSHQRPHTNYPRAGQPRMLGSFPRKTRGRRQRRVRHRTHRAGCFSALETEAGVSYSIPGFKWSSALVPHRYVDAGCFYSNPHEVIVVCPDDFEPVRPNPICPICRCRVSECQCLQRLDAKRHSLICQSCRLTYADCECLEEPTVGECDRFVETFSRSGAYVLTNGDPDVLCSGCNNFHEYCSCTEFLLPRQVAPAFDYIQPGDNDYDLSRSWNNWEEVDAWCEDVLLEPHPLVLSCDLIVGEKNTQPAGEDCEQKDSASKGRRRSQWGGYSARHWESILRRVRNMPGPHGHPVEDAMGCICSAISQPPGEPQPGRPADPLVPPEPPAPFVLPPGGGPGGAGPLTLPEPPFGCDHEFYYYAVNFSSHIPRDIDRLRDFKRGLDAWIRQNRPDWTEQEKLRQMLVVEAEVWSHNPLAESLQKQLRKNKDGFNNLHGFATSGVLARSWADIVRSAITPTFFREAVLPQT